MSSPLHHLCMMQPGDCYSLTSVRGVYITCVGFCKPVQHADDRAHILHTPVGAGVDQTLHTHASSARCAHMSAGKKLYEDEQWRD